jgi:SAM-dependent methyltransferase
VGAQEDAYDLVAYPGFAYADTHPDQLATMAILHGLSPAPIELCRVLEIGCGDGANLIPMAYALPSSHFVGFDLAALPISRGLARIRDLGLRNIRLFQANLLDADAGLGEFDYIIAHGLYAWVPENVQDRLLALCRSHLAPSGIAFVSYNALPGSHMKDLVRGMMRHQVKDVAEPEQRVPQAIDLLRFVIRSRAEGDAYRVVLEEQLKQIERRTPHAVYHDELSPIHHPLYFCDFVKHAQLHGLQYLSEAVLPPPNDPCYRADLQQELQRAAGSDVIAREQLLDFARMRMFRETLLCHQEREVRRDMPVDAFRRLRFASQAISSTGEVPADRVFTLPGGIKMETAHPGVNALMEQLIASWPRAVPFDQLEPTLARHGLGLIGDSAPMLLRLAVTRMIELSNWTAPVASGIEPRPRATATSRQEARIQPHAATLLHATLGLEDPLARAFLQLLDGTKDLKALLESMQVEFPALPAEQLEQAIDLNLQLLYRAAVLEA